MMKIKAPLRAAGLLLALAACAAPPPKEMPPPEPASIEQAPAVVEATPERPIEPATQAVIAAIAPKETPPEEPEPTVAEPVITELPVAEPEIDDDPKQLMGLAGAALEDLLGAPGYSRADADAQVWQYLGQDCILDIYLYPNGEETPHRVTYYEFRGDKDDRPCLRALLLAQEG